MLNGIDDGVTRLGPDPKEGTKWYIVTMSWYKDWQKYVGIGDSEGMELENV